MHNNWKKNFLRIEINTKLEYGSVEIEESKTISSSNEIYWMFGKVDCNTKKSRVFRVLTNRTIQKLLPIKKDNIYSNYEGYHMDLDEENDSIENEELSIKTRVFSDCFRSYQITDFNNLGLILKRVNQGVWFGISDLHINTIKSL